MFDFAAHYERLRAQTVNEATLDSVPEWIERHTQLAASKFSFTNHEYQLRILQSSAPIIAVKKCSQVGISEMSFRRVLALMDIIDGFSCIYTLPTATFAADVMKTRIDPIIQSSPRLSSKLNCTLDNASIKQIGDSFLYVKGTYGNNQAISVPADLICSDELDFSDEEVVSNFTSRLTHSKYKWQFYLSTPTVTGRGVDEKFQGSRRFYNFCKCNHCGHQFVPDYEAHVRIPGYDGKLLEITAQNIHQYKVDDARLHCPSCDGLPSLQVEHREWVCENPTERHEAEGFQVSPFDAPNIITLPYLIRASTKYKRKADFINFNLGKTAEDADSSLTDADIERMLALHDGGTYPWYVAGIDVGVYCHIVIAGMDGWGKLHVVKTEVVHYRKVVERYLQLAAEYRLVCAVMDTQPYVETVYRLQALSPILYGAVYTTSKNLEIFNLRSRAEVDEKALLEVRQVNVNRNYAFDSLMMDIREGEITARQDDNSGVFSKHLMDMKRVRNFSTRRDESYVWQKSANGDDHFHHALLYCYVAAKLKGVPVSGLVLPQVMTSFRVKSLV